MLTNRADALSPREREVLDGLARGYRGTELADRLELSNDTVRTHVRNAMRKLGARTRVQAVAIAVEDGAAASSAPAGPDRGGSAQEQIPHPR